MTTLAEIEAAVDSLPKSQQEALLASLAQRLGRSNGTRPVQRKGLKATSHPALEGLPADLSAGTKGKVQALVKQRHDANR